MSLTKARRARLDKLASYLETLPRTYRHFGMASFIETRVDDVDDEKERLEILRYARQNGGIPSCGTAACAAGHGPAAGILFPRRAIKKSLWSGKVYADWEEYCSLFVTDVDLTRDWCFGARWEPFDNGHRGAAARIRYLLANGSPPDGYEEPARRFLRLYAPYRIDAKASA